MENECQLIVLTKSGRKENFDCEKIFFAIQKANETVKKESQRSSTFIEFISKEVENWCAKLNRPVNTDEIGDIVSRLLSKYGATELAFSYYSYMLRHRDLRGTNDILDKIAAIVEYEDEEVKAENSNKNPTVNSVQRDYMAGEVSKRLTETILPPEVVEAHNEGIIHFHDADYFAQHMHNCCLVNLEDMFLNGTVISETAIDPPKSFRTACNVATQCVAQIASSQYGGQTISLAHLIPFVDVSRQKFIKQVKEEFLEAKIEATEEQIKEIVEKRLDDEIAAGVQMIQYQLITLMTTNGQAPFVSLFMYINECETKQQKDDFVRVVKEILNQRILGVKNEKGVYVTAAFPKLLYVLTPENTYKDSEYFWLTELAAKCSAKRLVPDYISEKQMLDIKEGNVFPCMGCRSFLSVDKFSNEKGNLSNAKNFEKHKGHIYYGRFNQGVVTLNLPDIACSAYGDEKEFWRIFDERLELCYKALMARHKRLLGTTSDVAPILWQHGALARLKKGEKIDRLLFDGYSTISLGYAGICECVYAMKHCSNTSKEGKAFAISIMNKLNDACDKWSKKTNIAFSVYGTPLESTTYKFAKALQRRFGIIPHVSDKNYITNSYHVHVTEKINAFDKLKFESEFQKLSPGGAISYIEVPFMFDNIDAVISVIQFMYENIMYAEINTKSDYCMVCGYDKEIFCVEDEKTHKLVWECPNCKNRDEKKLSIARRTCGYIGTNLPWNEGRTSEIRDRCTHL